MKHAANSNSNLRASAPRVEETHLRWRTVCLNSAEHIRSNSNEEKLQSNQFSITITSNVRCKAVFGYFPPNVKHKLHHCVSDREKIQAGEVALQPILPVSHIAGTTFDGDKITARASQLDAIKHNWKQEVRFQPRLISAWNKRFSAEKYVIQASIVRSHIHRSSTGPRGDQVVSTSGLSMFSLGPSLRDLCC